MNKEEWNTYLDTGFVPQHFIMEIVHGIKEGKRLNPKHLAIYQTHAQIIEIYLRRD